MLLTLRARIAIGMSMSERVAYLISCGEYSDYRILALYLTRELAEKALPLFSVGEDTRIEEYRIDQTYDRPPGCFAWEVFISKDGDTREKYATRIKPFKVVEPLRFLWDRDLGLGASLQVWATDKAHAVTIAKERRAQLIASGEWQRLSSGMK